MKCVLGFSLFWVGIGMLIQVFLPNTFWVFVMIGCLIALGYILFCK